MIILANCTSLLFDLFIFGHTSLRYSRHRTTRTTYTRDACFCITDLVVRQVSIRLIMVSMAFRDIFSEFFVRFLLPIISRRRTA